MKPLQRRRWTCCHILVWEPYQTKQAVNNRFQTKINKRQCQDWSTRPFGEYLLSVVSFAMCMFQWQSNGKCGSQLINFGKHNIWIDFPLFANQKGKAAAHFNGIWHFAEKLLKCFSILFRSPYYSILTILPCPFMFECVESTQTTTKMIIFILENISCCLMYMISV